MGQVFQWSSTSPWRSAAATRSPQSWSPSPPAIAPTSTWSTAAPAGVGTPSARPVSTMRPASFAASPSANCVGRVAGVDVLDHAVEVEVGDAVGAQHLHGLLHRDPRLRRDRQALEAHPRGGERDQAVHQLHRVAEPEGSEVDEGAAQRLQHRLHAGDGLVVTADHERQHAVLRADRAAGERRLDQVVTGRRQARAELADDLRAVRRQVDEHRRRRPRCVDPLVGDRPHDGRRRERQHRDLARRADVGHRRHCTRAFDRRRACGIDVEHDDVVAVGGEVRGDVSADVAQTDDADLHPDSPRDVGLPTGARRAHRTPWRATWQERRGKR